jgi:tRNA threonylcarbamoyladenosine biosynthesis protein TsaB
MVDRVMRDANLQLQDLDAIVLGNGPGSFIGMRIAASVAQGLAYGAGLKIVPVSSLAAVAAEVMTTEKATAVAVAQDARMNEVYLGLYRADAAGLPVLVVPEYLQTTGSVNWPDGAGWVAAGEGWQRAPELLEANRAQLASESAVRLPRARFLLALGEKGDPIDPQLLIPAYIRMKVAEPPAVRHSS